MVRQLDEEAARRWPVAAAEQRCVAFGDRARPGQVARPEPACQLSVTAARQSHQSLGVLGEERLAEPRHPLGPGHVGVRDEPAQAPPADLGAGQEDEMRSAHSLADPAQVLLDRRPVTGQPGAGGSRPGGPALGRIDGRPGSPAGCPRRRGRRGGMTMPDGSATTGSSNSISRPTTGWIPTASAALTKRTAPYRPLWSVTASPVSPSSTARSTRSSGADAPSRNEKFVWQWSSAYGVCATGRSGLEAG